MTGPRINWSAGLHRLFFLLVLAWLVVVFYGWPRKEVSDWRYMVTVARQTGRSAADIALMEQQADIGQQFSQFVSSPFIWAVAFGVPALVYAAVRVGDLHDRVDFARIPAAAVTRWRCLTFACSGLRAAIGYSCFRILRAARSR